jgi:short-subunit dehydrogenase
MIQQWIVIGATGGLGSAIASELAAKGRTLCIVDAPNRQELLNENARDLEIRSGHPVASATLDAAEPDTFATVLESLTEHGKPFGIVWAVGVMWDQHELEQDPARARLAHQINYTSVGEFLELAAVKMELLGGGHIVALGSPAGDRGRKSNYLYGAAKSALHTHMEGLRHRFANSEVTVTTVKPGPTRTPMTAGLKEPLMADPKPQAKRIVAGIDRGQAVVYTPLIWWPIMLVIRHLPRFIFDKLDL